MSLATVAVKQYSSSGKQVQLFPISVDSNKHFCSYRQGIWVLAENPLKLILEKLRMEVIMDLLANIPRELRDFIT